MWDFGIGGSIIALAVLVGVLGLLIGLGIGVLF